MLEMRRAPVTKDLYQISQYPIYYIPAFEDFSRDTHLNGYIKKPWGHEYRIYCDDLFDIWKLRLDPEQATSMHCHLRKDTVLMCLAGSGETAFIDGTSSMLSPGSIVYIKKGVFHQTTAGTDGASLVEVENPRNKLDLMRIEDHYGRVATHYEGADLPIADLPAMAGIKLNRKLRTSDIAGQFEFSLVEIDQAAITGNPNSFFVVLDIEQHLSGSIEVLSGRNARLRCFIGGQAFLMSART